MLGRNLPGGADNGGENFVECLEQPRTGNRPFFLTGEIKEPRQLLPVEARDRLVADNGDRHDLKPQRLKLSQRSGIVFNVSGGKRNAALRKKLFRAGASKSAGAEINFDCFHEDYSCAGFLYLFRETISRTVPPGARNLIGMTPGSLMISQPNFRI